MKHWALFVCVVVVLGCGVDVEGRLKSKRAGVLHQVGEKEGFKGKSICLFVGAPTNGDDQAHFVNYNIIKGYATKVLFEFSIDQCIEAQGNPPPIGVKQDGKPDFQDSYDYMTECMATFASSAKDAQCSDVVFSMHGLGACELHPTMLNFQDVKGGLEAYLPYEEALGIVTEQNQNVQRVHFASCSCPPGVSQLQNVGLCEDYVLLPGSHSGNPGWMLIPDSDEDKFCNVVLPEVVKAVYTADNFDIPNAALQDLAEVVPPKNGQSYQFVTFNDQNQVTKEEVKV